MSSLDDLFSSIDLAFPEQEMPRREKIFLSFFNDPESAAALTDLEQYREKTISVEMLRMLHQELRKLSASAFAWIVPHFLRFCLTENAKYSRFEAEYFLLSLSPALLSDSETSIRLSALDARQVRCVLAVLEWMRQDDFWGEYCPETIDFAIAFLKTLS